MTVDVRPSPLAGRWYPADASALRREVEAYLTAAEGPRPAQVMGLLAPHAGLRYSGPVAAYAFHAVRGLHFDTVIILCPSHFHDEGALLTTAHARYATPLGEVPVEVEGLRRLQAALPQAGWVAIRTDHEHAIEIELPFLQCALSGSFTLVPLMLRDQSEVAMRALGHALAEGFAGRHVLLIASSDLSHFQPQSSAHVLDAELLRHVTAFDPEGLMRAQADGHGFACGHGAIAAMLWATRTWGATHVRVVRHATSGDVTGDYDSVVGYAAALVWKP
jgi:AmmeMemoRadiSam system protein B